MSLPADVIRYSNLFGPSGAEDEVIREFARDLRELGLDPVIDPLGNTTAVLREAAPGEQTVMLSAHLDEIGFVVRKILAGGYLKVHRVGGVNDRVIAGQRLRFQGEHELVPGAVGVKAKHVSGADELGSAVMVDDAYVDVLTTDAAATRALGIEVGTLGTYDAVCEQHGRYLRGKAMDNRAAVALLLEIARRLRERPPAVGVVLAGTVQEEFSIRGGVTAARRVAPDWALCLDIAIATDTPDLEAHGDVRLGAGPVISRFTRALGNGIIPNPHLWRYARDAAGRAGVPVQYGVLQGGLTDGSFMQYEGAGIPTLDLSFATRYTHTAIETVHLDDLEGIAAVAVEMLCNVPEGFTLARG